MAEEELKYLTFVNNHKRIYNHNQMFSRGDVTFSLKMNQFADLTHEEFRKNYIGDGIVFERKYAL